GVGGLGTWAPGPSAPRCLRRASAVRRRRRGAQRVALRRSGLWCAKGARRRGGRRPCGRGGRRAGRGPGRGQGRRGGARRRGPVDLGLRQAGRAPAGPGAPEHLAREGVAGGADRAHHRARGEPVGRDRVPDPGLPAGRARGHGPEAGRPLRRGGPAGVLRRRVRGALPQRVAAGPDGAAGQDGAVGPRRGPRLLLQGGLWQHRQARPRRCVRPPGGRAAGGQGAREHVCSQA
ncbi:unnamed protein product, partial [Prorocentrum cordatum]